MGFNLILFRSISTIFHFGTIEGYFYLMKKKKKHAKRDKHSVLVILFSSNMTNNISHGQKPLINNMFEVATYLSALARHSPLGIPTIT